ncbi:MAG: aspartate aminotransferase family protein [Gemmatimonadaceae bacterium]|nr:aspartate aminotransferase family protein [Gemmatimonadaceae bacterium]
MSTTPSLDALWMPFSANRSFKQAPRLLVAADGMYYRDVDGRTILDATSGLWCVNAGHNRPPIVAAIQRAAATLDYAPGFNMGHPGAFALADRLTRLAPPGLDRVFFTNSGSESVDTALKIVLAYHAARGDTARRRLIGRERGYHGVGFGGISVGGLENNRRAFAHHLLPHTDAHLPTTHGLEHNRFSVGQPTHGAHLADALEDLVARYGGDTIAAVIVEPMAGSAGVFVPPVGYLERLRAICDRHGILLVFDEVITGFGRLGAAFGAQRFGVTPDLITIAKGLTNGSVPMGAVLVRRDLHDAVLEATASGIEFFHGYTYSGHPLACAAAEATLQLYDNEALFARAAALEPTWAEAVHTLQEAPFVIDVRSLGLVAGIELSPRPGAPGARGAALMADCFAHGLLIRVTGDTIALSPPLIVSESQIDEMVAGVRAALDRLAQRELNG